MVIDYFRDLSRSTWEGWNRFWFTPTDPATLGVIRILGGAMIFYTHLVWSIDLVGFFGPAGRLSLEYVDHYHQSVFAWSHLRLIESPAGLWTAHIIALVILAMLPLGLFSRTSSVLAFLITVSYAHRVPGTLFGLDQINALVAMYLMVGNCGAAYSLDRVIARARGRAPAMAPPPSVAANVGIRLMQLHMCIIYLFAGCGKLAGATWWDGTAFWGAAANYEYQSIDMTWLASWPLLVNFLSQLSVAWEVTYPALVWPRRTRPLVILLAIPLHMGIAVAMGMITFGLMMLIANIAFVSPALVRALVEWPLGKGRAGERHPAQTPAEGMAKSSRLRRQRAGS